MASRKSPKRVKISDERINEVAVQAAAIELPWDDISPLYFSQWLDTFSKAHGATKDLMFMSILPTVSSLLGLSKLQMTPSYHESLALFTLCICPPSGGKNQCFSLACKQPVSFVENKSGKCLLLDKFTEVGLRQHLLQNDGVALLMNEEMEDTLRQIQVDRESGTMCRLFDGDSLYINTGSMNTRQAIEQTSMSIGGFMQVRQFFSETYPAMVSSQTGFDLRFLFAVMRPVAHTRKQTQPFANELGQTNIPRLHEMYKAIFEDHKHGDVVYKLDNQALQVYDQYDEQICQKLNAQWQNGVFLSMTKVASEGGKERRLVLRLAVALFVLYSNIRRLLFQSYGPVPRVIPESCMKYAINLMTYFQQQRKEIDKILQDDNEDCQPSIYDKLVRFPGPVCTISNFRASTSSKLRKDWTPTVVQSAMEDLASEEGAAGTQGDALAEVITVDRTIALVKRSPANVTDAMLGKYTKVTRVEYQSSFLSLDLNLSTSKRDAILRKSKFFTEIESALGL